MINIDVQVTGFYREALEKSKFDFKIDTNKSQVSVYKVLDMLCEKFGTPLSELLYLNDGSIDDWSRVMINGKDIRFLSDKMRVLEDNDHLLIMSISGGG